MYHGTIIEIDDCLVSEEILTEYFACDYEKCKGCCCGIGDSGAPMEECEAEVGGRTRCGCGKGLL